MIKKIAVLCAAAAVLGVPAATAAGQAMKVTVIATEFHFKLSAASAKAGTVTFTLVNKGHLGHDFKIDGKKTPVIKPGKTATLTVTLKAGKYPYECTVAGHAAAGMKGVFTVK